MSILLIAQRDSRSQANSSESCSKDGENAVRRTKRARSARFRIIECLTVPRQSSLTSATPFFFPIASEFTRRYISATLSPLPNSCAALSAGQKKSSTPSCSNGVRWTMDSGISSTRICWKNLVCNQTGSATILSPPREFRPTGERSVQARARFWRELASNTALE